VNEFKRLKLECPDAVSLVPREGSNRLRLVFPVPLGYWRSSGFGLSINRLEPKPRAGVRRHFQCPDSD